MTYTTQYIKAHNIAQAIEIAFKTKYWYRDALALLVVEENGVARIYGSEKKYGWIEINEAGEVDIRAGYDFRVIADQLQKSGKLDSSDFPCYEK